MDDAVADMDAGRQFYESQQIGIGQYFWDSGVADIESLVAHAGIHQQYHGLPRLLCQRFPYAVYYDVSDAVVFVLAVLPVRRNPGWIKTRLTGIKY
jgi:hypothetical protein